MSTPLLPGDTLHCRVHASLPEWCSGAALPAGMIMWPKAKRAVSDETAAAIAAAARAGGAAAVGVFVDEDAATITQRCRQAGITIAQLHGEASRASLNSIPEDLQVQGGGVM